jgi:long-chain fatty acid transport protein
MGMVTNLQLMQFGVPMAYNINGFSIGLTPVLQYGSLDINYKNPMAGNATVGAGVSQDLEFGYNIGLAYKISNFTIGAIYKSQIDMEYKGQLTSAMQGFGLANYKNDKLSTPAELGFGVSYTMSKHTIAVDYKNIAWSDAEGYKDFAWEDQSVIAIGYAYKTDDWAVRVGYNYSESPIKEQETNFTNLGDISQVGAANLPGGLVNTFNLLGFPGIVDSHITFGGSYILSKRTSVDFAYAYAPEVTETFTNFAKQDITTTHSQSSLSLGLNYNF